MRKPAYTGIVVSRHINVSSSGHYFGKVFYEHHGVTERRYIDVSNGWVLYKPNAGMGILVLPAYVMQEIRRQFIEVLEGDAVFYEYDRDGEMRFDDLRYHRPEAVTWIIGCLRRDHDNTEIDALT